MPAAHPFLGDSSGSPREPPQGVHRRGAVRVGEAVGELRDDVLARVANEDGVDRAALLVHVLVASLLAHHGHAELGRVKRRVSPPVRGTWMNDTGTALREARWIICVKSPP